jgi:hypothetical protein
MKANAFLTGISLGAGLMYFFDPDRGRRRRKLLVDKVQSAKCNVGHTADVAWRDLQNRTFGTLAEVRSSFSEEHVPDQVLQARVRSKMGRYVSNPSAIEVVACDGCVRLSGPILAAEVRPLVQRIRWVPGVKQIDNQLDVHSTPGNVASLQSARHSHSSRPDIFQSNWSPAARMVMLALGSGMTICCAGSRKPDSMLLSLLGVGLTACSVMPARSQAGQSHQQDSQRATGSQPHAATQRDSSQNPSSQNPSSQNPSSQNPSSQNPSMLHSGQQHSAAPSDAEKLMWQASEPPTE